MSGPDPLYPDPAGALRMRRPAYGTASLADLLPSALAALGVPGMPDPLRLTGLLDGVRRIAVLLVDGLGAYQLPQAGSHAPTLADLATGRLGYATTLTSGFPSTTPTSLVTLGTGVPPGTHGVLGFVVRVPGTDRLLTHVRWRDDPDPRIWQPVPTCLETAAAAGVAVTVASRPEFAGSGLSEAANRGAVYRGAADPAALVVGMLAALRAGTGPTLVYGYHPDLDRAGHVHGLDSAQWRSAAADVDTLLARLVDGLPADAALLVTADHGQLDVPADRRTDLDADPRLTAGIHLVAGEPRVRYLHPVPGARDDVLATWQAVLGTTAWVATREEVVAAGWFGAVAEAHLARVGEVVAVCRDRYALLATRRDPPIVAQLIAMHGSFTAAEMTVPLIAVRGDRR